MRRGAVRLGAETRSVHVRVEETSVKCTRSGGGVGSKEKRGGTC